MAAGSLESRRSLNKKCGASCHLICVACLGGLLAPLGHHGRLGLLRDGLQPGLPLGAEQPGKLGAQLDCVLGGISSCLKILMQISMASLLKVSVCVLSLCLMKKGNEPKTSGICVFDTSDIVFVISVIIDC